MNIAVDCKFYGFNKSKSPRLYNYYLMPKYVLKDDVEKGLVDPTKPLDQQPRYK